MIHINTLNDWALTVLILAAIVALTVQLAQRDPLHERVWLNVAVPLIALVVVLGVAAWLFDLGARRKEEK